jgi:hypothetical protein
VCMYIFYDHGCIFVYVYLLDLSSTYERKHANFDSYIFEQDYLGLFYSTSWHKRVLNSWNAWIIKEQMLTE